MSPYIKQDQRTNILVDGAYLAKQVMNFEAIDCAGDINFAITVIIHNYLKRKGLNYQILNDITGALINADKEFYRKVVVPYEDKKIVENGDVN